MTERRPNERRGLGRGLSALMGDALVPGAEGALPSLPDAMLPTDRLVPNPGQPRRSFDAVAMEELAASVRARGILQPILVRPSQARPGLFEIVAGERRWRAAQMAQLHDVPVRVRQVEDADLAEIALIENIQRADLNPIEEAAAYAALMEVHGHTQDRLAGSLGKSRSHIANILRLLSLPEDVREMVARGDLSAGHARALVPLGAEASAAARQVLDRGLSVRATEALARQTHRSGPHVPHPPVQPDKDPDTILLEKDISAHLGIRVSIDHTGPGGSVTLRYRNLEELDGLCQLLTQSR
jgi:ParB family transcriptional regulator, chromosome partitioning protein